MIKVAADEYLSEGCWLNAQGDLASLVVMAEEDGIRAPYLVSSKCAVDDDYGSYGVSVILQIGRVHIVDTHGTLQRALPGLTISSSLPDHAPVPNSNSKTYYIEGKVRRSPHPYQIVYEPVRIEKLKDIGMSFEPFLDLSDKERGAMLRHVTATR
jgi:hypothetical protein